MNVQSSLESVARLTASISMETTAVLVLKAMNTMHHLDHVLVSYG